jgi:hypothetical protein
MKSSSSKLTISQEPRSDRPLSVGSEAACIPDPAQLGPTEGPYLQPSHAEFNPKLFASMHGFRYSREEIQNDVHHEILQNECDAEFEVHEKDRNEIKPCAILFFSYELLIKYHTKLDPLRLLKYDKP